MQGASYPLKYLGLLIRASSFRTSIWNPVITKINSRLASWKGRHLSLGGRICLLKSVLQNLLIYYPSIFLILKMVVAAIERKFRSFLWSGDKIGKKICNVKWDVVSLPKTLRGLGMGSVLNKNKSLIFKWLWRFGFSDSGLWKEVVCSIHKVKANLSFPFELSKCTGSVWSRIDSVFAKDSIWDELIKNELWSRIDGVFAKWFLTRFLKIGWYGNLPQIGRSLSNICQGF